MLDILIHMIRSMRRYKQEISNDECRSILDSQLRGVLAVLGDDDYPYTITLNHVYLDGKLYFHSAKEGHKIDAILKHEKVSYCVLDDGVREDDNWWYTFNSVIVFGKMSIVDDDEKILEVLSKLGEKFNTTTEYVLEEIDAYLNNVLILELDIEHITGKRVNEK